MPSRRPDAEPSLFGLRRIGLLDGVSDTVLAELARRCAWHRYRAGQSVVSRLARDNAVFLIVSGNVRVTAFSAAGRQVTYRDLGAGEFFGELAAIDGKGRSADVMALEDTLLASMPPEALWNLLRTERLPGDRMLRHLVASIRDLTERVFELSTLGVQNRLHAEILRLARAAGVSGNSARIEPAPNHHDLAGRISTYREQITRELTLMVRQGLIVRAKAAWVVPDVARLERVVEEMRRSA